MIELGEKVKCKVSGFVGIATSRVEYINGCIQYGVTPRVKKGENKKPDAEYIDEGKLVVVGLGINIKKKRDGGVMSDQPSH